ncbi:hypothetical protein [Devosia sp. CAU 1758]
MQPVHQFWGTRPETNHCRLRTTVDVITFFEEVPMSTEFTSTTGSNTGSGSSGPQSQTDKDLNSLSAKSKEDFDAVTKKASEDIQELGHQAKGKLDEASANAKSFADNQKNLAADQLTGIASAISKVADELDGNEQQTVARYARELAQGLSNVGTQIHQRDADDLMGAAEEFGRKQPLAFLGAAALTGFMASRFALASAHRRSDKGNSASQAKSSVQPSSNGGATGSGNYSGEL